MVIVIVIQEGRDVSHVMSINNQLIHLVNACDVMGLCTRDGETESSTTWHFVHEPDNASEFSLTKFFNRHQIRYCL